MKLYGTPPSHFTRKVRVLLEELSLPYEFVVLSHLMEVGEEKFAQNPLHQFPVLEDGGLNLIESDLICDYILREYGRKSPLYPMIPDSPSYYLDQKRLAIMNGGMAAGVKLIRAKRSEIPSFEKFTFFRQEREALEASLRWLERDLGNKTTYHAQKFTMLEINLMCFVEWALFREMIPSLENYPNLAHFVHFHKNRPSFERTHPSKGVN